LSVCAENPAMRCRREKPRAMEMETSAAAAAASQIATERFQSKKRTVSPPTTLNCVRGDVSQ
jgi:hypothetical protein